MPERFLSSEEYDEQAHKLYNDGDYDGALEMLKEGLALYPNAVDLYVGLGYARLAREEYAWARHAFERAVVLAPVAVTNPVVTGEVGARLAVGHVLPLVPDELAEVEVGLLIARIQQGRPIAHVADELGIYDSTLGNWVKQGHPVRAQGQGGRQVRTGPDSGQIYDHHFVELEYEGGGRVLSQCRHMPGCMSRVSEAFHGTSGTAPRPGVILSASGRTLFEHDEAEDPNPYQVEHDELFAAIAAGEHAHADAELGATATMTAIHGRMATNSGQVGEWDEALASDLSLMPDRFAWDAPPPVLPDEKGRYPVPTPGVDRAF